MIKVLIVEDDEFFRSALESTIDALGHTVRLAEHGQEAIQLLSKEDFDCVISDIQMPVMDGFQLSKWMMQNKPTTLILMTGYSENMDTQTALRAGAKNILYKPFTEDEVIRALEFALPHLAQRTATDSPYCRIPMGCILGQSQIDVNIYAKDDGKIVKIASRGETLSLAKMEDFKKYGELYTERESLSHLIPLNLMFTRAVSQSEEVNPQEKFKFIQRTGELLQEKIKFEGASPELIAAAQEEMMCLLENVNSVNFFELLKSVEGANDHLFVNTLGVACCSIMLARRMKWPEKDILRVAIASFFHDVGKADIERGILDKARTELTVSERLKLQDHCRLGYDRMAVSGFFQNEICDIVMQHHENNNGTGYPQMLKRPQIHIAARLIRVSDAFCLHALRGPSSSGMKAEQAFEKIKSDPGLEEEFVKELGFLCGVRT